MEVEKYENELFLWFFFRFKFCHFIEIYFQFNFYLVHSIVLNLYIGMFFTSLAINLSANFTTVIVKVRTVGSENIKSGIHTWTSKKFGNIQREALNTKEFVRKIVCLRPVWIGPEEERIYPKAAAVNTHHLPFWVQAGTQAHKVKTKQFKDT